MAGGSEQPGSMVQDREGVRRLRGRRALSSASAWEVPPLGSPVSGETALKVLGLCLGLFLLWGCTAADSSVEEAAPQPPAVVDAGGCIASYRSAVEETLEVDSGYWRFGLDVYLMGCRENLQQLTDDQLGHVLQHLQPLVEQRGLEFLGATRQERYRQQLVGDISKALETSAITDILIVRRYSIEYEPELE